eukprot:TRINITY_DN5628_c0_g2_i14.p1 TRINITY_DN5628_c0_g2~~TRINITY_DN5628_c0_g2_i14.p1  ORF type:complete len:111 (+),score=22.84 TRINITY_DN5628_c0_g2_i14:866-1198(+)
MMSLESCGLFVVCERNKIAQMEDLVQDLLRKVECCTETITSLESKIEGMRTFLFHYVTVAIKLDFTLRGEIVNINTCEVFTILSERNIPFTDWPAFILDEMERCIEEGIS